MRWKTTLPFAQLIKKSIAYIYQSFCYFKSVTLNMNTMYLKTLFSFSNFNEKISVNNLKVYILFNSLPLSFQLSNYQRYSHLHHSSSHYAAVWYRIERRLKNWGHGHESILRFFLRHVLGYIYLKTYLMTILRHILRWKPKLSQAYFSWDTCILFWLTFLSNK